MDQDLRKAVARVVSKLLRYVLDDPQFRQELQSLAEALQEYGMPSPSAPSVAEAPPADNGHAGQSHAAKGTGDASQPEPNPPRPREPLPELTLGRSLSSGPKIEYDPKWALPVEPTLDPSVAARCRLKAQAMQYMADRLNQEFGSELAARYAQLIEKANTLQPCFLWMLTDEHRYTMTTAAARELGHCYETLAEVLEVVRTIDIAKLSREELKPLLCLVAEAQSALRAGLLRQGQERDDDQLTVYNWVRKMARYHQIFIERYMQAEDQAHPELWESRLQRAHALKAELTRQVEAARQQQRILKNLRYKIMPHGTPRSVPEDEWPRIAQLVHQIVEQGMPASAVELRELLLPVVDQMPLLEELPTGFAQVLEALDKYRVEQQERAAAEEIEEPEEVSPQVAQAAALLAGRALVLIGGDERPHLRDALIKALRLSDLYWVATRSHESIDGFEPWVRRPDVAAVLLAIRWASHSYGDVHQFCKRYGKPLVRLPRGCNPNQVAAEILRQCSRKLQMNQE
jgi:hypothetical protein